VCWKIGRGVRIGKAEKIEAEGKEKRPSGASPFADLAIQISGVAYDIQHKARDVASRGETYREAYRGDRDKIGM
jgi:hypothetical protein